VTTRLSKSSDRTGAVTFTVTGRINPGAVSGVACAGGHMSLSVKRGSRTLLTALRTVGSTCTFRKSFKTSRRSVGRATRLAVSGRFLGSEALGPRSASSKSIRVR
jgi:hypothetical protein